VKIKGWFYNKEYKALLVVFWTLFICFIISVWVLFYGVTKEWFGALPKLEQLENPKSSLASEVISSDGVLLGKYYLQNRSNATFKELSPNLIHALIATEDIRFYKHSGIDLTGTFAIMFYTAIGKNRGSSTITQQLAKNLYGRPKHPTFLDKVATKFKEWVVAVRLEERYTKEELLTLYFNTVAFSGNAYGIKSGSTYFFDKTPDKLTQSEAAMLIGILKGVTYYSPIKNPDRCLDRRNTVLHQMTKYGYLSDAEFKRLKAEPIVLNLTEEDHNEGIATYFREWLRLQMFDWCKENGYDLYRDGLRIYTTIDSRMQHYAEEAVTQRLSELQKVFYGHWKGREPWGKFTELIDQGLKRSERYMQLKRLRYSDEEIKRVFNTPVRMKLFSWQGEKDTVMTPLDSIKYYKYFLLAGFMSMDPTNGQIKAWVGGPNYKYFKYDHVNPESKRQVGSTFKPLVYTLAVDNGYSPCQKVPNLPVTFEDYDNYTPTNADGKEGGELTLYKGLQMSVNNIVMYLMKKLGPDGPKSVIDLAHKMGVSSTMEPYPSIALGAPDISVYEMVGAFATYANKGVWTEPVYVTRIEDKEGNVIKEFVPRTVEAMSEQTAYVMCKMMERVVLHGTAAKLRYFYQITAPTAGKTGTTQNNSDGWFMSITPNLVSGVWVGCEDRAVHFRSLDIGSGSNMAMPIYAYYAKKIYADSSLAVPQNPFMPPKEDLTIEINCDNYENDNEGKIDFIE
jgi:penicillin-binding protein 1A